MQGTATLEATPPRYPGGGGAPSTAGTSLANDLSEVAAKTALLETVRQKHAALDRKIQREQAQPSPDWLQITALKRQKLLLKEEICRLENST